MRVRVRGRGRVGVRVRSESGLESLASTAAPATEASFSGRSLPAIQFPRLTFREDSTRRGRSSCHADLPLSC